MGGNRNGILGTEANIRPADDRSGDDNVLGGGDMPGSLGQDDPIPMDVPRIIAKVIKDWDPPNPTSTPSIDIPGATLAQAGKILERMNEWGEGGGSIRNDPIAAGNTTNLTVNLYGNLVRRLPNWLGYNNASAAAKAEWDRMVAKLTIHEDRHVAIAVEEADRLAQDLIGKDIYRLARMVTQANARMAARQQKLDHDTDGATKPGVQYGDVSLDTSIV